MVQVVKDLAKIVHVKSKWLKFGKSSVSWQCTTGISGRTLHCAGLSPVHSRVISITDMHLLNVRTIPQPSLSTQAHRPQGEAVLPWVRNHQILWHKNVQPRFKNPKQGVKSFYTDKMFSLLQILNLSCNPLITFSVKLKLTCFKRINILWQTHLPQWS